MREGFSRDEVYDVLAGMGLPGEQVQLVIDRVKMEFEGAGLEPRPRNTLSSNTMGCSSLKAEFTPQPSNIDSLRHWIGVYNWQIH